MDLQDYRKQIDEVNMEIVKAVSKRMNIVDEIKILKEEKDLQTRDEGREEKVKQQFEKLFEDEDLPKERGRELADLLISMAVDKQQK